MIFPDGKTYPVKNWASILVNVIVLNFQPYHKSGDKFKNPHKNISE
ncbi:MAG: hypothetical protein ABIL16_00180 [candidate division WOR-3 bacterium]